MLLCCHEANTAIRPVGLSWWHAKPGPECACSVSGLEVVGDIRYHFGVVTDGRRLLEPVRDFLAAPRCAVLSTLGRDGAPRQIVTHYTLYEDHVRINGHRDRRWVANIRRDPRIALIVQDDRDYLHYVSIRGRATLLDERDDALAEAMSQAERYGEDPADFAGQPRVSFRVDPERVTEYH
jgi:PPOX class probable F420-dependent enzyme